MKQLKGSRNENNLLTTELYQSTMVTQTLANGLEIEVDDDGVIQISGKATEDWEGTIAVLTLEPGTYTLGGYATNLGKAGLKAVVNGAPHYAGVTNTSNGGTFTVESTASVSIQIFVKKDASFLLATTFKPTLAKGTEEIDFYK